MAPKADPQDSIGDVFRQCRDYTEKIDALIFAVTELGDGALGEKMKAWKDAQSRVGAEQLAYTAQSIDEMKNSVGVESAEQARAMIAEARGEKEAERLPDTAQGAALEEQLGAEPEKDSPADSTRRAPEKAASTS